MSKKPLKLGIAGLGTVGVGTIKLLQQNAALIAARCGREIVVSAVSARDAQKDRHVNLQGVRFVSDALQLATDPEVDVVVEVIGGSEGVAKQLVEAALAHKKPVVTANKALMAHHGLALAKMAEQHGTLLAFEAAVAGGIPIIKALRDGLGANSFTRITGILNGTCNYILTTMREQKKSFEDVLREAQALGYAEADPSFDVDGVDTAHKLSILTSLAFGTPIAVDEVHVEGIRAITARDIEFAEELGYRIRLLGIAEITDHGLAQHVHPCMVPADSSLGAVDGVYNAVVAEGDAAGRVVFEGRGAGAGPTASAIVADIMDVAGGVRYHPFTIPVAALAALPNAAISTLSNPFYVRLSVIDKSGVLADITTICRDHGISVRSFLQHSHRPGEPVQVVLTTHATEEANMHKALARIGDLPTVLEPPHSIRIMAL